MEMRKIFKHVTSHPVWGAWIEIYITEANFRYVIVAPRVGCVD